MATESKPTPEEQLLRLIEGPVAGEVTEPETEVKKTPPALTARLKNIFLIISRGGFNLKTINRLLVLGTVLLMVLLSWEFTATQPSYGADNLSIQPAGPLKEIPVKEGYYYDEIVSTRNAFKPVEEVKPVVTPPVQTPPPEQPRVETPPPKTKLDEIINTLKLKGVSWDPVPPMAIIEDNNISYTHVLAVGETLKTKATIHGRTIEVQIKIKEIKRDNVVLSLENEEQTLVLMAE